MGADPIRPRAARHAVMAAYYQIAGAAERSVSPTLVGGALAAMARGHAPQAHRGNANSTKCKPSSEPERPSSSLGSALAIFSVAGRTSPRPPGGAFFIPIVCALLSPRARRSEYRTRSNCCAGSAACMTLVLVYVLPICATPPEFRCIG